MATLLAGRCTTLDVHPLSFAEYLEFRKARRGELDSVDEAFAYYLRYGGMPGLFYVPEGEEFWHRELRGIYESVLLKDVALRCAVRDMVALDRLARYVLMMGGNLFSTRKVGSTYCSTARWTKTTTKGTGAFVVVRSGVPATDCRDDFLFRGELTPGTNGSF